MLVLNGGAYPKPFNSLVAILSLVYCPCLHLFRSYHSLPALVIAQFQRVQTDRGTMVDRVNLRTQKRLASSVLGCGKRRIWLDPNEISEISNANSRQTIRKLFDDGLIIRKPVTMHSRSRARALAEARRIGRHRGFGKRKGTKDARMPRSVILSLCFFSVIINC